MEINEMTEKVKIVADNYAKKFGVQYDGDWFLLKLQEELGEMTRAHLMLTDRTRRKVTSMEEGRTALAEEIADVMSYVLLFADQHNIDVERAVREKWFKYLE